MSAYQDPRNKQWRYRRTITLPDGSQQRISGTPEINTRQAADMAEREHIARLLSPRPPAKEVPTVKAFVEEFIDVYATPNNKFSEVENKQNILDNHVLPGLAALDVERLDQLDKAKIEAYKARKVAEGLKPKTINNHLIVINRMLVVAEEWGRISKRPRVKWMKAPEPETDFLTFEEANALDVGAAGEGEIGVMIVLARHTGLRHGELLGLQWTDVDLKAGRLVVRRSYVRGRIGTPKSGKSREVPLNESAVAALRKLPRRGLWVFCDRNGELLTRGACKWPLWRACKAGGLRRIGWHALRHTFASHLVMRGVPLRVVQVLLGHASIEETERYSHLSPDISKDAVRLLEGSANGLPTSSSESRIVGESK